MTLYRDLNPNDTIKAGDRIFVLRRWLKIKSGDSMIGLPAKSELILERPIDITPLTSFVRDLADHHTYMISDALQERAETLLKSLQP